MERKKARTKAELVDAVAELGITKKQAMVAVDTIFDTIKDTLKRGGKVSVVGFGTFLVKEKNARRGRNPRTGERIKIPAKFQPAFKAGNILKQEVKDAQPADEGKED